MGLMTFEKNKIDLDKGSQVTWSITDSVATDTGASYADYMRDRSNDSGWGTTGSTDAAGTTVVCSFGEELDLDTIILLGINWKNYTIKYWDGAAWQNFSQDGGLGAISETTNADAEKLYRFAQVSTTKLQIVINGTMVADSDKFCAQLILTKFIYDFVKTEFEIANMRLGKGRKKDVGISGKARIQFTVGAQSWELKKKNVVDQADLTALETLHDYRNGFLVSLCGFQTGQYRTLQQGYRKKDLPLMVISTDWEPIWDQGMYARGINVKVDMVEAL